MVSHLKNESEIMPYTLDFAKFVGGFILFIGVALIVLHVVSVETASLKLGPNTVMRASK